MPDSLWRFASLGGALSERGLGIQLPLTATAFDVVAREAGLPPLRAMWGEARGALLVGSAGTRFFERFQAASSLPLNDPLDSFTRDEVEACCRSVLGPADYAVRYPFVHEARPLPFQRLAVAAGAPPPGPLGLIVLREAGPWWAFRALVLLPFEVPALPPRPNFCASCDAPCVGACPGDAVHVHGFDVQACGESRQRNPSCAEQCLARRACPVGSCHAYASDQVAFHAKALLRLFPSGRGRPAASVS